MSDLPSSPLARSLYKAIAWPYALDSEPPTAQQMVDFLMRQAKGSGPKAAHTAGIPERTFRYLRNGRAPSAANLDRLRHASGRVGRVSAKRIAWLNSSPGPHVVISGEVAISGDVRFRKMYVSGWPWIPGQPATHQVEHMMARVLIPWMAGDDPAAERVFMAPVDAGVGHAVELRQVFAVRLFKTAGEARRYLTVPTKE